MRGLTRTAALFHHVPPGRERRAEEELRAVFGCVVRVEARRRTPDGAVLLYVDFEVEVEDVDPQDREDTEWRWMDASDAVEGEILLYAETYLRSPYTVVDSHVIIYDD